MALLPYAMLPLELQDKIMAHLPLSKIFALRTLSKRSYNLPFCPLFLQLYSQISVPVSSWLILPKYPSYLGCMAFNPSNNRWYSLSLSSLPLNLQVDSAKSGVLVFLSPDYRSDRKVYIYNPLRRDSTVISCPDFIKGSSIVMDLSQNRYKILVLSLESALRKGIATLVYDSCTKEWKEEARLPVDVALGCPSKRMIHFGNKCFILGRKMASESPALTLALMYDTEKHVWSNLMLPDDGLETKNWLMQCKDSLFLAQMQSTEIHVWMLDMQTLKWVDWGLVPQIFAKEFVKEGRKEASLDDCTGLDQFLILCKFPRILAFDTVQKTWRWLPDHPALYDVSKSVFCVEPSLCTIV